VARAAPIVEKAWPDLVAVQPLLRMLIQYSKGET